MPSCLYGEEEEAAHTMNKEAAEPARVTDKEAAAEATEDAEPAVVA